MAFKSSGREQGYFIIAKHSGKALGVSSGNRAEGVKQFAFDSKNKHLQFQFHGGTHFFWMVLPPWYLCTHNSSTDDGVPIIQWEWAPNDANLMFQVMPAGDGYYRIKSLNSQKFWDVYGAKTEAGAGVVQHRLMASDNQLFQIIPVPKKPLGANPKAYVAINEEMRTCLLGAMGLVPEVGGVIKGVVGLFWTEADKMGDIWNQMKSYVDERIRELLLESRLETLNDMIEGITSLLKELDETSDTKGDRIQQVMDRIVEKEPHFFANQTKEDVSGGEVPKKPYQVLPYIVGLGCIMLPLRKLKYANYAELFGHPEPTAAVKEENKGFLNKSVDKYLAAVASSRADMKAWRMGKIQNVQSVENWRESEGASETWYKSFVKDDYDGWYQEWNYYEKSTMGGTRREGYPDHRRRADFALAERKKQIEVLFDVEIDQMVRPSRFWKYLKPGEAPYVAEKKTRAVGAFGGVDAQTAFAGVDNKRITKIKIHSMTGGNLCGLEVFYDNTSDGLKGKIGNFEDILEIAADDYITSAYGFAKDIVEALYFITKEGVIKGGGTFSNRSSQHAFAAELADSVSPKLARISGAYSHDIQQLTFYWEYMD